MASAAGETAVVETDTAPKFSYKNAGPEPKHFAVGEGQLTSVGTSSLSALLRGGSGALVSGYGVTLVEEEAGKYGPFKAAGRQFKEYSQVEKFKRPALPLELYEFEGCPFCKKVREAISTLDLDVRVYPCPKDGPSWRPKAIELGGKAQFPFLLDPNSGKQMYESDDIVNYLFTEYGDGKVPLALNLGYLTTLTAGLGLAARAGRGSRYRKSRLPEKPLVLWGYDASPFVKPVREVLTELELPYLYVNAARGSPKRQQLLDKVGHFQVPYLEDPNAEVYLFESAAIVKYLEDTYATP